MATFKLEEKSIADKTRTKTAASEKRLRLLRHAAKPKKKRTKAEVHEAEKFCPVEGVAPGTFLYLKTACLPEAE